MTSVLRLALALFLLSSPLAPTAGEAPPVPHLPGDDDRCPVCGMMVAPYPAWIAQILFVDGSSAFFDGSKDLFKYIVDRSRFAGERSDLEIAAIFVTSYYDLEMISAEGAFFVIGSDTYGPMGPELIPHATLEAAEEFLRDHRGNRIIRFDDVDSDLLKSLS